MKEKRTKNLDKLYSVCNYRNDNHFGLQTTWSVKYKNKQYKIQLWAKIEGKAGTENKYDFPPPVDEKLYFGTCCLVGYGNEDVVDLSLELWEKLYEKLFGGFETLGDEDSVRSEDTDDEHDRTTEGYSKEDNFVVSDNELEEENFSDTDNDTDTEC